MRIPRTGRRPYFPLKTNQQFPARWRWLLTSGLITAGLTGWAQAPAAGTPPPVDSDPAYHLLDFWIGEWEVVDASTRQIDGHNLIEKVLKGAAIVENWRDVDGHEGRSWFYYYRPEKRWKQVWVTDVGFVKEKVLIETYATGGVRFRGEITLRDGRKLVDQTTLTPLPDGRVRQVIEQSADGGVTWKTGYDAYYTRVGKGH